MHITAGVHHKESCVKSYGMYITSGDHHKESCVKVTECISHQESIIRKVALKLRNVYHSRRSSEGKLR